MKKIKVHTSAFLFLFLMVIPLTVRADSTLTQQCLSEVDAFIEITDISCSDKEWVVPSFYTQFIYPELLKGHDQQISFADHFSQECLDYLFPTTSTTYAELKSEFHRKKEERPWYDFFGANHDLCYKPLFTELNQHLSPDSNSDYRIQNSQALANIVFEMMKYDRKRYAPKDFDPPCSTLSNHMYKTFYQINQYTSAFSELYYFYIQGPFMKYRDDQGKIQNTNWMYHAFLSIQGKDGQTMIIDPFNGVIPISTSPDEWIQNHYIGIKMFKYQPDPKNNPVNWRAGRDFMATK